MDFAKHPMFLESVVKTLFIKLIRFLSFLLLKVCLNSKILQFDNNATSSSVVCTSTGKN